MKTYILPFLDFMCKKHAVVFFAIVWACLQVVYCLRYSYDLWVSDSGMYCYYATECAKLGSLYPNYTNLFNDYIFNPGWVNFLVLWIGLFGDLQFIPYFNIFLNIVTVYLIYIISNKLYKSNYISPLASYLYMMLPGPFSIVIHQFSEPLFLVISLLSINLILGNKNRSIIFAGSTAILSYWIRPLGISVVFMSLFYFAYKNYNIKKKITLYLMGFVSTYIVIGCCVRINFPYYQVSGTTGAVNLLMGANDAATGGYCGEVIEKGHEGYLEGRKTNTFIPVFGSSGTQCKLNTTKYSYKEISDFWNSKAIDWILKNPIKWIKLRIAVFRNMYLMGGASFFETYTDVEHFNTHLDFNKYFPLGRYSIYSLFISLYFAVMALFLFGSKENIFVNIPVIIATGMTMITVGISRYSYIMMPFVIIYTLGIMDRIFYSKQISFLLLSAMATLLNFIFYKNYNIFVFGVLVEFCVGVFISINGRKVERTEVENIS